MLDKLLKIKSLYWILLVFVLAFALRFLWLGMVPQIYFDEVNYLYDALKYQKGVLLFERESIAAPKHPLLSLLFMQYGISLFGFNYLGWRIFSVIFGSLSVVAFYFLVRDLFSERAAFIASLLLALDFLHLVLSRIAMVEIYLLFFVLLGFYFLSRSLKHERSEGLLLAGTFFGLSIATKWVGIISLLSGYLIYMAISKDPAKNIKGVARLIVYPLILFFMVSLVLNLSAGMDIFSWFKYEFNNFRYHQVFSYKHPFNAPALTWPFLLRSTPLFFAPMGKELLKIVVAFGNPAVYWIMIPASLFLAYQYFKEKNPSILFIFIGFLGAYLPWLIYEYLGKIYLISARGLFFYYFLPAIPFFLAGLAYLLDVLLKSKMGRIAAALYIFIAVGLFLFFSPLLYGLPVSPEYLNKLIWIKGWIY